MLDRILETEAMDTPEEAASYDAMDHAEVNARFVADFLPAHGPCRGGWLLDVGTGTARIPIQLCRQDTQARVLGLDLARSMLDLGARNVDQADFSDRIRLELADAKDLPAEWGPFEAVISNTIVHHIPEPAAVLKEMVRRVEPGGTLFVRDLTRPETREELDRLVETHAGREAGPARALFADSLHAALSLQEVRTLVGDLGLPPEGVTMTSDRHWTLVWRRPPLSPS
ncbi:MAG TPA: class I SAM-dependent methyltransferase [Isosphaeraceae bacterium]|nr:class I SAM-dependent methyltransferase [Isosphaeraceae bacterium]